MVAGSIGEWAHRSKESDDEFILNKLNYINNLSFGGFFNMRSLSQNEMFFLY